MDLDNTIDKLLVLGEEGGFSESFKETEVAWLCGAAQAVLASQASMLELGVPITICGDVHGQFVDLLRLFSQAGYPPETNYLFLGDYVDRGKQSLETICLLMAYKIKYADNFFLLRGNHECAGINRVYGFYDECRRRFSTRLWKIFQGVFNQMPFCALVASKIFCMHGGLSPHIRDWDQLRDIQRPVDPGEEGLLSDLLWADPDASVRGWAFNSERGVSFVFGADVVQEFCRKMDIDLIARAHQVMTDGYELFAGKRLVTIFSAPNYCGEFKNSAAMMRVDESLTCSFQVLRPITNRHQDPN